MTYHRLCARGTAWIARVTQQMKAQAQRPVWPIIEVIKTDETYAASKFAEACRAAARASGDGMIAFTLEGLLAHEDKLNAWRAL